MDYTKDNEDDDGEGAFFIGDFCSSDDERIKDLNNQKRQRRCKPVARLSGESSPPLLLAFPITSGPGPQDSITSPASSTGLHEEEEEEDSEQPIEDWMILGEEEQVGDSSIQLNLGYWSSSEDDCGDEDLNVKSLNNSWAVSEKDKCGRYFVPGRSVICQICNRTGHFAKSCYYHKKCPTCVLCGIQGHVQRDCPSRPCSSCGLPSHGLRSCEQPPVWKQHCQRCGVTGHLFDACPDTWRQYHLTIWLGVPQRPRQRHTRIKHRRHLAHCYNCSKRGHYGFECTKRRMVSGTFPSLPYVSHYDTIDDILQCDTMIQKRAKAAVSQCTSDQQQLSEPTGESGEENQLVQGRNRTKQKTSSKAGRRKTWPERRRERQEVKRLRREAQARREGGLLGRSRGNSDDETRHANPLRGHWRSTSTPPTKKKEEDGGKGSRKTREAERWKKRAGIKHGDLYPHGDADIGSEDLFSPKQRVRHRRR